MLIKIGHWTRMGGVKLCQFSNGRKMSFSGFGLNSYIKMKFYIEAEPTLNKGLGRQNELFGMLRPPVSIRMLTELQ